MVIDFYLLESRDLGLANIIAELRDRHADRAEVK